MFSQSGLTSLLQVQYNIGAGIFTLYRYRYRYSNVAVLYNCSPPSLLQGAEAGLDRREQVPPRGGLPSSLLCTASLPVDETVLAAARQVLTLNSGPLHSTMERCTLLYLRSQCWSWRARVTSITRSSAQSSDR